MNKIVVTHPNLQSIIEPDQIQVPMQELEGIDNASCISLHLADCMDYVPPEERGKLLSIAIDKLRYGGEITVSGTDLISVGQQINHGIMNLIQANVCLFQGRLSGSTINDVIAYIKKVGIEIINAKIDNLYYSIKARRPNV